MTRRQRVVVIGGGITGLTVCYRLIREAQARHLPLDVVLLEASERLGGVIATSQYQGLVLEHGPDCFITTKPWGLRLCEELGLTKELLSTTTQYRQSFIVRHGRLLPVPQGFYLMAPGALWPFLTTPLFSWRGKLRMACDLWLPRRRSTEDESLAHFVTRRLGREALERMAQPMVGGIYTADPQSLSMQATLPQFVAMERQHGSLIRALLYNQRMARQQGQPADGISGPRYGLFVSLRQGMQTLIEQLAERLPAGTVRVHSRVRSLQQAPETQRWTVHLHDHPPLEADALCLALAAPQAGYLLADCDATLATALQEIPYASSAVVNVAFRRADVAHPLNGMGFVVPAVEQRHLLACSFSSVKFAGRAPEGQVLLRAFVGGALHTADYAQTDTEILHTVGQELRQLLGITGDPLYIGLSRHPQSMAQYHLEHVEQVTRIESLVSRLPGLVLAGNAYHGVGIPDCIHSGDNAARALFCQLAPSLRGRS